MQKNIFKISIILLALSTTGCVQRTLQTSTQEIIPQVQNTHVLQTNPILQERPIVQTSPIVQERPIFHDRQIVEPMPIDSTEEIIPQAPPMPVTPQTIASSTAGEMHHVRTVQGTSISIQERSNGFAFPEYQDKIVILSIFGKNCPYCFREIPIIKRLQRKYSNTSQIIALQAQDPMGKAEAASLIQSRQMNYPVIDKNEAIPLLLFIQNHYEWTGSLPTTLIIKNGVTEQTFKEEVSFEQLDEIMRDLI